MTTYEGVLPVFKSVGYTSHDVVAKARRILHMKRIGHTGTLDPQVTGVLPLCLGKATRMVEYIQELPKEYEVVFIFGVATDTEDLEGEIIEQSESVHLTEDEIRRALASFVGTIQQKPPMYSAVKANGKRLYELARKGIEVERESREVQIFRIEILELQLQKQQPEVKCKVLCSKGTYIRTLCVDIGKVLGYPAVMAQLIRTAAGHLKAEHCYTLDEIQDLVHLNQLDSIIIPMDQAICHIPAYTTLDEFARKASQGQKLMISEIQPMDNTQDNDNNTIHHLQGQVNHLRLYTLDHQFLGIFQIDLTHHIVKPVKVLSNFI